MYFEYEIALSLVVFALLCVFLFYFGADLLAFISKVWKKPLELGCQT